MITRVLSAELLKIRKKAVWLLIVLGPLGIIGLQAVNFGLRYDYLTKRYASDLWGGLLGEIAMLTVPTLFVGLTIVASMTAGIEHQTNAWKQTLALPVTRTQVFAGKFVLNALLLFCSATLLVVGAVALGVALGFDPGAVPYGVLLKVAYCPYLAIMPFVALQLWMSVTLHNQAVPLTVGIAGMVVSMFSSYYGDWVPYKWPSMTFVADKLLYAIGAGLALGVVVLLAGIFQFARKDVL